MVRKRFLVVTGLAALLVLSGKPILKSAEAQHSALGLPKAYQKIDRHISTWNAASAVRVTQINSLTVRDMQRQMAAKVHDLDERGVTGSVRQRELTREASRLRRRAVWLKQVHLRNKDERHGAAPKSGAGPATAHQMRDPFALSTQGASALPRHLSPEKLAQMIRTKMAERTIDEARRAARSRRLGFNGLYPGWSIIPISRT